MSEWSRTQLTRAFALNRRARLARKADIIVMSKKSITKSSHSILTLSKLIFFNGYCGLVVYGMSGVVVVLRQFAV